MNRPILPSWREGSARSAILAFLDRSDVIPPVQRVAVFDNDGTLMCEKPNYVQLEFMLGELRQAIAADPSLADRDEFHALIAGDRTAQAEMGLERVAGALVSLFEGLTPEAFDARVSRFFAEARHPERIVPFRRTRYQPMLELIDELRSRDFDVYLVTGGGAEFVRTISKEFYGVRPEGVVGSQIDYQLDGDGQGTVRLLRTSHLVGAGPNEGPAKPPNIQRILGRRPVVAGGNSAGDAEMLDYATSTDGPSLALLVHHDDADREYAYASEAATFATDESILETAARSGWTVASMRDDWSTVFADS
jgi:hypothetical protein